MNPHMNKELVKTNVLPLLGTCQFYTLEVRINNIMQLNAPENGFYWVDDTHTPIGPFRSLYDAVAHYRDTFVAERQAPKPVSTIGQVVRDNVIRVDFANKRRI